MQATQSKNLFSWIKTHPKKALLFLFLIIIPVTIITLVGINFTNKGKGFYFDTNNDKPVLLKQKDLSSKKEINKYFKELKFELVSVASTMKDEEKIDYATFEFKRTSELTDDYSKATVTYRYLMTANWFDEQSSISTTSSTNFTIYFPYNLPKTKYLFLKVNKPILYIEVLIKKPVGSGNLSSFEETTLYLKYDLNNVKYTNVID